MLVGLWIKILSVRGENYFAHFIRVLWANELSNLKVLEVSLENLLENCFLQLLGAADVDVTKMRKAEEILGVGFGEHRQYVSKLVDNHRLEITMRSNKVHPNIDRGDCSDSKAA